MAWSAACRLLAAAAVQAAHLLTLLPAHLPAPAPHHTSAEERGAARGRGFSPEPLAPTAYAGQDVVAEEEDTRLLELLRSQVGTTLRHGSLQLVQPSDGVDGLP